MTMNRSLHLTWTVPGHGQIAVSHCSGGLASLAISVPSGGPFYHVDAPLDDLAEILYAAYRALDIARDGERFRAAPTDGHGRPAEDDASAAALKQILADGAVSTEYPE